MINTMLNLRRRDSKFRSSLGRTAGVGDGRSSLPLSSLDLGLPRASSVGPAGRSRAARACEASHHRFRRTSQLARSRPGVHFATPVQRLSGGIQTPDLETLSENTVWEHCSNIWRTRVFLIVSAGERRSPRRMRSIGQPHRRTGRPAIRRRSSTLKCGIAFPRASSLPRVCFQFATVRNGASTRAALKNTASCVRHGRHAAR